jgi:UDP:flavonoid glycosyltransferase YjiC (YdhE family)
MRVLFTCVPQAGHIMPLLPLAEAFAQQGDEVCFATGADAADPVSARGLGFRAAGPPFAEWYERLRARTRGMPGDGLPPARVERYFLPRLFGEVGAALMLDGLLDVTRDWRPDLLVFDPLVYAAPLVAAASGVRAVLHTVGPFTDPSVVELVADAVSPMWRELGHEVPQDAGLYAGAVVAICPESLDPLPASISHVHHLRPTDLPRALERPAAVPAELWERPVVYLTLGTFSNTNLAVFRTMLEAVAELPVSAVVTIGRGNDAAGLGAVPANAHVAEFIPQAELLPHSAAVVHHAGAGTAFGVLAHGLPSVALPQSADNFVIAKRLAEAKAARVLMPGDVTVEALHEALRAVLEDASTADGSRRLADEIAAMAAPEEVARLLAAG